ncbi:membrane protein [Colletotrichum tofieldiae]|uniref:Membrane protein n=1 Tax=Colletotrichum tofieldiae TaxID=708197 RepID=A0A166MCG9_9PEZI|nr:membrane protein [Colletotrichum tofieldiae]
MHQAYNIEVLDRPGHIMSQDEKTALQDSLCRLGALCLSPLPKYQVFDRTSPSALDDKLIVIARHNGELVAFISTIWLPIMALDKPLLHSGLTVIHPTYQKSGINLDMFANLFLHLVNDHPEGFWMSTLAAVISSLVNISKYTTRVFPSPEWSRCHPSNLPSEHHLAIAREINANHRDKMLISPNAVFDEDVFVFKGSNDSDQGEAFQRDMDDERYWHRDQEASVFFRKLLRRNKGDEVLQISFLEPAHLASHMRSQRFASKYGDRASKVTCVQLKQVISSLTSDEAIVCDAPSNTLN